MTKSQYLSLQDASLLVNKSPQTLRRLIKGNKVRYRKYKTPQGFTYLVEKTNLARYFEEHEREEEEDELLEEAELVEEFDPTVYPTAVRPPISQALHAHEPVVARQETYEISPEDVPRAPQAPAHQNGASHLNETIITQLVQQHREDKRRLFELLETFQKRILILEDQLKQLEAPPSLPKRRRFFFF
jgi:hypothetical protein